MAGDLEAALETLLTQSLPGLFGTANGKPPAAKITISSNLFEIDPLSGDATASEPRPDDRIDILDFDADSAEGPYTLSQVPYPGPRRVWLLTDTQERLTPHKDEVMWDENDSRVFTLRMRSGRNLASISKLQILYSITAIFTKIKASRTFNIQLQTEDATRLPEAEALVLAVLELNRQHLIDAAKTIYEDGIYSAQTEVKSIKLIKGTYTVDGKCLITLQTEFELRASRTLSENEGQPIKRILTPGRIPSERPIDIDIDVEA